MQTPSAMTSRIGDVLCNARVRVITLGLFGSARYDPKCRDIDVLLICETPDGSELYDYDGEMEQIARLMSGIDSDRSVLDPCVVELVKKTGAILANEIEAPIDFAFGPSPREKFLTQATIHLNGPVTQRMWTAFGKRFPIHVASICNTFQCFLGNEPARPSKIDHVHVREMATLLEQRIARVGPSERLARKLLQALGTLSGARTCHVEDLVEATFATRHQTRLALEDFSPKSASIEKLCKSLLAELYLRADAMKGASHTNPAEITECRKS